MDLDSNDIFTASYEPTKFGCVGWIWILNDIGLDRIG
jgi:hypothetical protein